MNQRNPFEYSGFATTRDFQSSAWREFFSECEERQKEFFLYQKQFLSPSYVWPRDPVHTWNRVWEYPYILYHIRKRCNPQEHVSVVDLGSGVTFFPFLIASHGFNVIAVDSDETCERDFSKALEYVPPTRGHMSFLRSQTNHIPLGDSTVDILYSISVIEHVDPINFPSLMSEISRVIKPGGYFFLTCDLSLDERDGLSIESLFCLLDLLERDYYYKEPMTIQHPKEMLRSNNSLYLMNPRVGDVAGNLLWLGKRVLKKILRQPYLTSQFFCLGVIAQKKI